MNCFAVPFHQYSLDTDTEAAVIDVLRSGWLTGGARVQAFETAFAQFKVRPEAIATSSCTAGLSLILAALQLPKGSAVLTTPYTFVSTAHVVLQQGLELQFADIDPKTLALDVASVAAGIKPITRAIIVVHVGGNFGDMRALQALCKQQDIFLIEDCAHNIEGSYLGLPAGTLGHASSFSFYPTKNITAGEGGMILYQADAAFGTRLRLLRNHGLTTDAWARQQGLPFYEVEALGYKANMTDIQAAIGLGQLRQLAQFYARRKAIMAMYKTAFADIPEIEWAATAPDSESGLHLAIILLQTERLRISRNALIRELQAKGIQTSVHFKPVHLFHYYRSLGFQAGQFPVAEAAFERAISLPLYPALTDTQVEYVCNMLRKLILEHRKA
jgi:dTDP-4-amino-4,6-dideoxygalactose transaminase